MYAWKCSVGWCQKDKPTNISEITFLDDDKYVVLPTGLYFGEVLEDHLTATEVYNKLKSYIGNGADALYATPCRRGYPESSKDLFQSAFPSIYFGYPNTIDYVSFGGSGYIFNYIPSLGYYFAPGPNGTAGYGTVDDNGIMSHVGYSAQPFSILLGDNLRLNCSGYYLYKLDDLKDSKNYIRFDLSANDIRTDDKIEHSISINGTPGVNLSSSLLSLIFQNGTDPDEEFPDGPPDNPYQPNGPIDPVDLPGGPTTEPGPGGIPDSGEGGGDGTFDDVSDEIPDSPLPTLSSANTGFTRIYNPTLSQVQDLARYLWTDESVIKTIWNHIKQFFESPMEALIGFNLVPCAVPDAGSKNFALMFIDTGVSMNVAANQFVDVNCGTLELKEYFGSYLDYSPYTKVSCYLPFIGTVQLNVDEIMKTTLQVKYRIDICSGACVAKVFVNGFVLYQFSGHCAIPIPFSAADFSSYVNSTISVAKLAGMGLAAGSGAATLLGAEDAVQQTNQVVTTTQKTYTARNPATGRQITTGTVSTVETREAPVDQSSTQASFSGLSPQNISNTVAQVISSKPTVEHTGSFSGNSGYLGVRRPYLIIERPNICMPKDWKSINGFPSMITMKLSECSGFTRIQQVQLTGLSATNPEQAEILELLKSGVIF